MSQLDLTLNEMKLLFDISQKNYQILVLNKNFLKFLPCEYLPSSLKHLSLDQNDLHNLEIDVPLPHLQTLSIERNDLQYLELSFNLSSLKSLNLKHNKLWNLEFLHATPCLETLNLARNDIQTLENLPSSLKVLNAEFNDIVMCPSRLPEGILDLNLLGNYLKQASLPLHWSSSLKRLQLGYNQLKSFPKGLPDSLEDLGLQCNQLTELPSVLPSNLKRLSIVGNRIRILPVKTNIRLEVLLATHNCLTEDYEKQPLKWAAHFFESQNWNEERHHTSQRLLRKCWKRYILGKRLRHIYRARHIYEELLMVALHPDHILQTDTFSPEWFQ